MPVAATSHGTAAVVGVATSRRLSGALAVRAAEDAPEDWSQARQATGNDSDVEFDTRPDGDVLRIPKPVAEFSVVGNVAELDNGGRASEDTEAENGDETDAGAEVHVEVPQHRRGDNNGEEEIGNDVECGVGVR